MSDKLLIHCPANNGFSRILSSGDCRMKLTGFALRACRPPRRRAPGHCIPARRGIP
jgi:hypothetical protein